MKKTLGIVIALVVVIVLIVSMSGKKGTDSSTTIKIGLTAPITGEVPYIGEAARNAALLAIEEVNAKSGLKNKYELVVEDDAFNAQKAASTVNKLVNVDKASAVISIFSTVGNVTSPITQSAKVVHFGIASDPKIAIGEYNFLNWTRPQEEATAMVAELIKRKITKVAILGVNQQGFRAIVEDFKTKAAAAGITIIADELFNPGQKDFRTHITKLSKLNADILFLAAFDPEVLIIGKQIADMKVKTPLTSIESFGVTADPKAFEGHWFVDATLPTGDFSAAYQKKFGKIPGPTAPNVYDSVMLLVNAYESIEGEVTNEKAIQALNTVKNYSGALGTLTPGPEGAFISEASVQIIKDGKAEALR